MRRFEYRTVKCDIGGKWFSAAEFDPGTLDVVLNSHGQQGWELVSSIDTNQGGTSRYLVLIFKRELTS
jgi:hypothetical protein